MTPDQLKQTEARLHALREELLRDKDKAGEDTSPVELDQSRVGRLSRMDAMQQQAMALEQDRRRDTQLKRIEGAFQRLKQGTYGACARCGEALDADRLEFDPTVFFCVTCAKAAEKR
jgi:DnaK suppressor protein